MSGDPLVPKHGGYRRLKSFQVAQLIYDLTVRFCDRWVDRRSRTHDQMVQAARSGVQNIAEGSQASGTSRKMELKLTNVARASLEELRLDYEDYLRQRDLPLLPRDHPALVRFRRRRCATLMEVRLWVAAELAETARMNTDEHGRVSSAPLLVANAALSLLNVACHLLDRQIASQAQTFLAEGGITERLHRLRSEHRRRPAAG
jgi:four helix bundle suffix protein